MTDCKCGAKKVITVSAHSKDCNYVTLNRREIIQGYAPGSEIGLDNDSGNDDVVITYCGDCGQILNDNFPVEVRKCWEEGDINECEPCKYNDECEHADW